MQTQRILHVQIYQQNPLALLTERNGKIGSNRGLANTTLAGNDSYDLHGLHMRTVDKMSPKRFMRSLGCLACGAVKPKWEKLPNAVKSVAHQERT